MIHRSAADGVSQVTTSARHGWKNSAMLDAVSAAPG